MSLGDLNGDGILDLVTSGSGGGVGVATVRLGAGNGTFGAATSYTAESFSSLAVSLGDLNGDGFLDLVTAGDGGGGFATIRLGTGNGTFASATSYATSSSSSSELSLGDLNGDGILDLVASGSGGGVGVVAVRLGAGNGTFGTAVTYTAESGTSLCITLGDLNGDNILDLATSGTGGGGGFATVRLGTGNGAFGSATSYAMDNGESNSISLGDLNGDGILDIVTAGYVSGDGGYATVRLGAGNGSFGAATSYTSESFNSTSVSLGDLNGDGVLDMVTAGSGGGGKATIRLGNYQDGISGLISFSLETKADALQAMGILQNAQSNLAKQRGVIGANQSRVEIAVNSLISSKGNFAIAESRIRDADMAADAADLVRTQILQQAATAVLAQANQAPALALTLLRS